MLIVHLITDLSSAGAQRQLQQFVLASDKRSFRHIVVSLREEGPVGSELVAAGVEVYSLRMTGFPSPLGLARLIRLLQRIKPDVLHCWLYHACLLGSLSSRLAGARHLVWGLRSANHELRGYGMMIRISVRACARLSFLPNSIIVNSDTGRAVHAKWGYKCGRMRVVPNGVDVERFHPNTAARISVREELGIARDSVVVGMIARYHPAKDHRSFLQAAARVHQQNPEVSFLFAGEGMTVGNQEVSSLVQDNGLRQVVHLLGSRQDIPRLTSALDLVCLSSWTESFPNVLLEAMACAVPCVATNVGDCFAIVGDAGRIVPPKDPLSMAAAMSELLAMPPGEFAALGQRARKRILAQFALPRIVGAYQDLYEGLEAVSSRQMSVDSFRAKPDNPR